MHRNGIEAIKNLILKSSSLTLANEWKFLVWGSVVECHVLKPVCISGALAVWLHLFLLLKKQPGASREMQVGQVALAELSSRTWEPFEHLVGTK